MGKIIEGITSTGFKFTVDLEELEDDFEFVEEVAAIVNGSTSALPNVIKMMIGEEQYKNLKEHCRKENGKVSSTKMITVMTEIFEYSDSKPEVKN